MNFNLKKIRKYIKLNAAATIVSAVILLVVGTFLIWVVGSYLAGLNSSTGPGVTASLSASDHDSSCKPLDTAAANPSYPDCPSPTQLTLNGTNITIPRFQGGLSYLGGSGGGTTSDLLTKNLVWAWNIPTFDYHNTSTQWGSTFPLDIDAQNDITNAKKAGVDGFVIDTLPDMNNMLKAVNSTTDAAGFYVAPSINFGASTNPYYSPSATPDYNKTQSGYIAYGNQYCSAAAGHSSAAKVGDKLVVFAYSDPADRTNAAAYSAAWTSIKAGISCPIYWVGKLNAGRTVDLTQTAAQINTSVSQVIPYVDAGYNFENTSVAYWSTIISDMGGKPFFGGSMPGYYRSSGNGIDELTDSAGIQNYISSWNAIIANKANGPWTIISSWNDFTEHTNIDPDSDLGTLRSDFTAWYSAKFKGVATSFATPQLYAITPQALYLGQSSFTYAQVINPTSSPVVIHLSYIDRNGKIIGGGSSGTIPANSVGGIARSMNYASSPSGNYVRTRVSMDAPYTLSVTGAPTLVYPASKPAGYNTAALYYSVGAAHALSGSPTAVVVGTTATPTKASGTTVRFLSTLHDQNLLGLLSKSANSPYSVSPLAIGAGSQTNNNGYEITNSLNFHLYVAREIDSNNNIGYSTPIIGP